MKCANIGNIYINLANITCFELTPFKIAEKLDPKQAATIGYPAKQQKDTPASLLVSLADGKTQSFTGDMALAGFKLLTDLIVS
jgi:hypothetical protein